MRILLLLTFITLLYHDAVGQNNLPKPSIIAPSAFLSLHTAKESVYEGECLAVTLAFNVADTNRARLQFSDLGMQLGNWISKGLQPANTWFINKGIANISGTEIIIKGKGYTTYEIYQAVYCPTSGAESINFPSFNIKMLRPDELGTKDSLVTFKSKPTIIKVKPLPANIKTTTEDFYTMCGNFSLSDNFEVNEAKINQRVLYAISLKGEGLLWPIQAPKLKIDNVSVVDVERVYKDSIINEIPHSTLTFVYTLSFDKEGVYNFSDKINFNYFDPLNEKRRFLTSKAIINISGTDTSAHPAVLIRGLKNSFITIDASLSMMLEDYAPNRLGAVKSGVSKFLTQRSDCNIGLIMFEGDAMNFDITTRDSCYSNNQIHGIRTSLIEKRGTAIGNATYLAIQTLASSTQPDKIVIISDGDNTAGVVPSSLAIRVAKNRHVTVYTIGVGHPGLVPFGKDPSGTPNMVENTFDDATLKLLATSTSGKYFWAKDADDVSKILAEIFK